MTSDFDTEKDSNIKYNLSKIKNKLSCFSSETNYEWEGQGDPSISDSEDIFFVLEGKFSLYHEKKLSDSTIVWTKKRAILYGTEVRKSLVASMVSRELEEKRGLDKKIGSISPPTIKGWDNSHNTIKKVEIISNGAIYSVFFFSEDERLYIINDLSHDELEPLKSFLEQMVNVEVTVDEFRIPLSDILLLFLGGIGITIVGWILIVLLF
ncbi:MAG: hypothetical protein ACFFDC_14235 [Promethearchaeota archaeon]